MDQENKAEVISDEIQTRNFLKSEDKKLHIQEVEFMQKKATNIIIGKLLKTRQ
jgi:hypothetical protein